MAELTNEFTWSFSRHSKFSECPRSYFYSYYGSWGGWKANATPLQKQAYLLKKLTSIPLWKGDLVHRAIEMDLRCALQQGKPAKPGSMEQWLERTAREEWAQSKARLIIGNPSRAVCLFDHYVAPKGTDPALLDVGLEQVLTDSRDLYRAYEASRIRESILSAGKDGLLSLEVLDSIVIARTKVWVKMDLAFNSAKQFTCIVDWKTGKVSEAYKRQLAIYGFYAEKQWRKPLTRLRLLDVHLAQPESDQVHTHTVAREDMDECAEFVADSVRSMQEGLLLPKSKNNPQSIGWFTQNNTKCAGPCRWCNFRPLCYPAQEQKGDVF